MPRYRCAKTFSGRKDFGWIGHKQAVDEKLVVRALNSWCFSVIERKRKLILAFEVGKRTVTSASRFIGKLAIATNPEERFQLTTDALTKRLLLPDWKYSR